MGITYSCLRPLHPDAARLFADLLLQKYPRLVEGNGRLARAVEIAGHGSAPIRIGTDWPGTYEVYSLTRPGSYYIVDPRRRSCTCPDSQKGAVCKHRLAVAIMTIGPDLEDEHQYRLARERNSR